MKEYVIAFEVESGLKYWLRKYNGDKSEFTQNRAWALAHKDFITMEVLADCIAQEIDFINGEFITYIGTEKIQTSSQV